MNVPLLNLRRQYDRLKPDIRRVLDRVMEHQKWILGPEVKELERRVAERIGVSDAVGVASGTDALLLSLRALARIRKGGDFFTAADEIITTPFTFVATGEVILHAGATPVFADVDPGTYNLDPSAVRKAVTKKTVGVIAVHLYGQACDMDPIVELCREKDLFIVEDAAQAFGASYRGNPLGSFGHAGAFSFFPSKNLGGFGDGGMITTNDPVLAGEMHILRKHGGRDKYLAERLGYNSRLDTIQAAFLLAKLDYVDEWNELRKTVARRYGTEIRHPDVIHPEVISDAEHVYHQYTIRVAGGKRDLLKEHLNELGIASAVYYPVLLNRLSLFDGRSREASGLKAAEQVSAEVLSLPMDPLMTNEEIKTVVEGVNRFS